MSRGRAASPFSPSSDREYRSRSEDVAAENSATLKGLIAPSEWPEFPLSSCKANGELPRQWRTSFLNPRISADIQARFCPP